MATTSTSTESPGKNEYPKATNGFIIASIIAYFGGIFLLMSFCSPYWIEAYKEAYYATQFRNMGLWEYCFKEFVFPNYQFIKTFNGCHNIFSYEYYVIREWLVPGWLMTVQTFLCIAFILTFTALAIMALVVIRWPLKVVIQYEWLLTRITYICIVVSASCMLLGVIVFGANAYRRDWLLYPKFNVLSWSYSLAVLSMLLLLLAAIILYRESKKSYELKSEAKNLVAQMEMHEPGYQPRLQHHHHHSQSLHSQSRSIQGYI